MIFIHSLLLCFTILPSHISIKKIRPKPHGRTIQDIVQTLNKQHGLINEPDPGVIIAVLNQSKPLHRASPESILLTIGWIQYYYQRDRWRQIA